MSHKLVCCQREARGIELPLPAQASTTMDDRLEKGVAAQAAIFGEGMKEAWKKSHINRWLAANCFGDYYTRGGLDLARRTRPRSAGNDHLLLSHGSGRVRAAAHRPR